MKVKIALYCLVITALLVSLLRIIEVPNQAYAAGNGDVQTAQSSIFLADGEFVYGPNVGDFDTQKFISTNLPVLSRYSQTILFYAEEYSINPKILISYIVYEQGNNMSLSDKDFNTYIDGLSSELVSHYYQFINGYGINLMSNQNASAYAISNTCLVRNENYHKNCQNIALEFRDILDKYFPDYDPTSEVNRINYGVVSGTDRSLLSILFGERVVNATVNKNFQFPYPYGQAWYFNGVHSTNMSGIDFSPTKPFPKWGSNTSSYWVVATANDTAVRKSNCRVQIDHGNGWTTKYYHLENIQFKGSKNVVKNQKLANIANTPKEATCEGGSATGSHLHFGLLHNGAFVSLNGTIFTGWNVHSSTSTKYAYSTNCNIMYMKKGSTKICPTNKIKNAN